LLLLHRVRIWA